MPEPQAKHWLYAANPVMYRVDDAFQAPHAAWPMSSRVDVGDVIFFYLSSPVQRIRYRARVSQIHLPASDVEVLTSPFITATPAKKQSATPTNKTFMLLENITALPDFQSEALSFASLKQQGLQGALMGPRKLENNPKLQNYILKTSGLMGATS